MSTSNLDILPFSMMCVNYMDKISVEVLDPVTEKKSIAEVLVQYPYKPLVCTDCHSLGHKVGAFPSTKRVWW